MCSNILWNVSCESAWYIDSSLLYSITDVKVRVQEDDVVMATASAAVVTTTDTRDSKYTTSNS